MMKSCISLAGYLLLTLPCTLAQVSSQRYCATISSDEASGATGWYNLQIDDTGTGRHTLQLDLSEFTELPVDCDLSLGLTYHFHSFWNDTSGVLSGDNGVCGPATTGNHYDPYLACGPNTQETELCTSLGRTATSTPPYSYPCSPEAFNDGHYEYCVVGDTSGKFGRLFATDPDLDLYSADAFDPSPPLISAYETDSKLAQQWASVVVHCGSIRLLCAKFLPVSDTAACGEFDTSSEDDDDTDLNFLDLSQVEGALLWTAIIVVGVLGGIFIGYKLLHGIPKKDGSENFL